MPQRYVNIIWRQALAAWPCNALCCCAARRYPQQHHNLWRVLLQVWSREHLGGAHFLEGSTPGLRDIIRRALTRATASVSAAVLEVPLCCGRGGATSAALIAVKVHGQHCHATWRYHASAARASEGAARAYQTGRYCTGGEVNAAGTGDTCGARARAGGMRLCNIYASRLQSLQLPARRSRLPTMPSTPRARWHAILSCILRRRYTFACYNA